MKERNEIYNELNGIYKALEQFTSSDIHECIRSGSHMRIEFQSETSPLLKSVRLDSSICKSTLVVIESHLKEEYRLLEKELGVIK